MVQSAGIGSGTGGAPTLLYVGTCPSPYMEAGICGGTEDEGTEDEVELVVALAARRGSHGLGWSRLMYIWQRVGSVPQVSLERTIAKS